MERGHKWKVWYLSNNVQIQVLHMLSKVFRNAYFEYLVYVQEWTDALPKNKEW